MRSKQLSAERKVSLLKLRPSRIACFPQPWGSACSSMSFSYSWGIFLDSSNPGNFGRRLLSSWGSTSNYLDLRFLGLRIMYLIARFCFAGALFGKKYLVSPSQI